MLTSRVSLFSRKLPIRLFSQIYNSEDNIVDIGETKRPTYRGSLLVVPTPIGNLSDMSLRQFEALTHTADIIACEDTRKTGKLLELMLNRRMKSKFKSAFGAEFETFFDSESTADDFKEVKVEKQKSEYADDVEEQQKLLFENSVDDKVLESLIAANEKIDQLSEAQADNSKLFEVLQKLENELLLNKSFEPSSDSDLVQKLSKEDKQFIEQIDQEYYSRVKSSDTFYRRKSLILQNLQRLQQKVEAKAKSYDDFQKLRFILLEKAKQKKTILKSYLRHEQQTDDYQAEQNSDQSTADDFELLYGLENEQTKETKDKIRESKLKKGRGLLLSFYEFNQELRIPRLIRAMKMGFRVALVSDAGTPTISDPGFKLTSAAHKEGIAVEALPGPCALTTAISAAGFPSERFTFMGYLPKLESEKVELLIRSEQLGQTVAFYDSPNRLVKSLQVVSDIYGENHEVFVGLELTKMHESHHRGPVGKVLSLLREQSETQRLKGEVTLVIAPGVESDNFLGEQLKKEGFDKKDASVTVNMLRVAETLNNHIDMSEAELRELLKKVFETAPSYHINSVARLAKKGKKEGRFERLARITGGVI